MLHDLQPSQASKLYKIGKKNKTE
ncbi:hypothetical protein F383_01224 [Gossypium arboreum]|uniref:Uncharacterized protein n=1 Tax=Gossypium arboreum TaxID=29729 RepID=A0A0B0NWC1_GOSAR|nr:hypothetical protein F383_01224 [Gossypium arboreum]